MLAFMHACMSAITRESGRHLVSAAFVASLADKVVDMTEEGAKQVIRPFLLLIVTLHSRAVSTVPWLGFVWLVASHLFIWVFMPYFYHSSGLLS
jgi:hypothetical protein